MTPISYCASYVVANVLKNGVDKNIGSRIYSKTYDPNHLLRQRMVRLAIATLGFAGVVFAGHMILGVCASSLLAQAVVLGAMQPLVSPFLTPPDLTCRWGGASFYTAFLDAGGWFEKFCPFPPAGASLSPDETLRSRIYSTIWVAHHVNWIACAIFCSNPILLAAAISIGLIFTHILIVSALDRSKRQEPPEFLPVPDYFASNV